MSDEIKNQDELDGLDLFLQNEDSYEAAVQRFEEDNKTIEDVKRYKLKDENNLRILPLKPGGLFKGYAIPVRDFLGKLEIPGSDKTQYFGTIKAELAGFSCDPLNIYRNKCLDHFADDEETQKIIKDSFTGGISFSKKWVINVIDLDDRKAGIQRLTVSNSQYKDIEERKLGVWAKLQKRDPKTPCPLSSINGAFPLEIKKKVENKKTSYSMNIDAFAEQDTTLTKEEIGAILKSSHLSDSIYRYTRYHLEGSIEFMKQFDAKLGVNILEDEEVKKAIETIDAELGADDSHFSFKGKKDGKDGEESESVLTFATICQMYDEYEEKGLLKTKGEEFANLKQIIRDYATSQNLDIAMPRQKSLSDILDEIEEALEENGGEKLVAATKPMVAVEKEEEPAEAPVEEEEVEENPRETRNDDTNEPAVRTRRARAGVAR